MKRELIGLLLGLILLIGCATQQTEVKGPEVTTPPSVEETLPQVTITKKNFESNGWNIWEWRMVDPENNRVIIARRLEAFEIHFHLIFCVTTETEPAIALYDERGTEYDVAYYNYGDLRGLGAKFRTPYQFLNTYVPTNPFYLEFPQEIYMFELNNNEWDDMISVVIDKEGV